MFVELFESVLLTDTKVRLFFLIRVVSLNFTVANKNAKRIILTLLRIQ